MKVSHNLSRSYSHSPFRRNPFCAPVLFSADDGANNPGGDNNNPSQNPPSVAPQPNNSAPNTESIVRQTIDSVLNSKRVGGDTSAALEVLAAKALREEQRARDAEAKNGQLPADVQTELESYRAFGKPDELKTRLENESALVTEKVQRERTDGFRKACAVAGYDADAVLEVIGEVPESEVVKTKQGDKETEAAMLKIGDESKLFGDVMAQQFPRTHESLKASPQQRTAPPVMGVNGGPMPQPVPQKPPVYSM